MKIRMLYGWNKNEFKSLRNIFSNFFEPLRLSGHLDESYASLYVSMQGFVPKGCVNI